MDNVVGTANILNYARNLDSLERFAYFSTDEVFGPALEGVFTKKMIDIIQLIHIQLRKLVQKNWL